MRQVTVAHMLKRLTEKITERHIVRRTSDPHSHDISVHICLHTQHVRFDHFVSTALGLVRMACPTSHCGAMVVNVNDHEDQSARAQEKESGRPRQ